jgi:hypothetical protein
MLAFRSQTLARSCAVQVESNFLRKGISLLLDFTQLIVVRLYISRAEVPGYLPPNVMQRLQALDWEVFNDECGQEFALVYRLFPQERVSGLECELTEVLEALGAPRKHSWKLDPVYS